MKINIVNLVVGVLALTLIGCANNQATEKRITVGNKNFTEQYIVGQLIKQVLENNGFKVDLRS
ncbi:MAG: glycine/betaine ABC transporter substrate-binding protein, partial [Bacteroidetes bacterium]|nr:glycine/betaine ABC transporter substrate-binding protein [Bacteroidota bacterium]